MKYYFIKVDPRSIKLNPHNYRTYRRSGPQHLMRINKYNKEIDGEVFGITEEYLATGIDHEGSLINPILVARQFSTGGISPEVITKFTREDQQFQTLGSQPKFIYDYSPEIVQCFNCKKSFQHTELLEGLSDWAGEDYSSPMPESCDTICPMCGTWWCCNIQYEHLSDDALEKRMTQGINQVVIEEII